MTAITHHIRDDLIQSWVAGQLPPVFAVLVAAHVSLCSTCRQKADAALSLGGALLDVLPEMAVAPDALARAMAALDAPRAPEPPPIAASGIFPAPVMQALGGRPPRWRMLGGGIRQQILMADRTGSLRLLYIPPTCAVPEHSHGGMELTLVLQGSFHDSEGRFNVGDVESADGDLNHQPIAGAGEPCICLAATDAPLRFRAALPRLLQPLFRI